ncbi:unannotated protein [freshwater metagenome]|uniref:Unannotated protein n=1 Tax=freshwater metagenome TaxID=449393 RepID=A0A6J7HNZ4_9ZZZZ
MAGAVHRRHHAAHDRARRHDRQHCAAAGSAGSGHQRQQPRLGHHRLRVVVRRTPAARRTHRRLLGTQALVHRRHGRLRRCLRYRRTRSGRLAAVHRARRPGCVRCAARPGSTGHPDGDVHRHQGTRQSVRRLRRHCRWRRSGRPTPRRSAHRIRELALVPAGQHPGRSVRHRCSGAAGEGEQGSRRHPLRPARRDPRRSRSGLAGLRLHRGRRRLGDGTHHLVHRARPRSAGRVRRRRIQVRQPAAALECVARP